MVGVHWREVTDSKSIVVSQILATVASSCMLGASDKRSGTVPNGTELLFTLIRLERVLPSADSNITLEGLPVNCLLINLF